MSRSSITYVRTYVRTYVLTYKHTYSCWVIIRFRRAVTENVLQEVRARHKVHISSMKAAWTEGNRNVVLTLYDSYTRAKVIRKSLSAEALKAFRVDSLMTPQVQGNTPLHSENKILSVSDEYRSPW